MGLVRGLVMREPDVTIRPEDLARTELGLQVGKQCQHGCPDVGLVDRAMIAPVGLAVVDDEPVVELDGTLPEPGERRHVERSPGSATTLSRSPCPSSSASEDAGAVSLG